ncbi:hypothetical protein F5884DRAFT_845174 [Xylogone sp. PMI_703]|nr:hypothetical protein F5884DRAFT_845174 [Xylogone sp. PMI_703]
MKDLVLLHHWSTSTSVSILGVPELDHMWRDELPKIAFCHEHLMHAILSIASLHTAYLYPSQKNNHIVDAVQHYNSAIQGFRKAVGDITNKNCDAVFGTATLNTIYVFATCGKHGRWKGDRDWAEPKAYFLDIEWINLIRGVKVVLHPVFNCVKAGPLSAILSIQDTSDIDLDAQDGEVGMQVLRLKEIWSSDTSKSEDAECYNIAVDLLRQTVVWMTQCLTSESSRYWCGPFLWIHYVLEGYVDRLRERQPSALVIFACFGALIHRLDGLWWGIVEEVSLILGPYWSPWIEWPRYVVGLS